ncbi:MAG: hypothetical protein U1E27_02215, partial [Kiritimatiellia bacterium]|nr:hypothetical protein [Kiritimatiellia bacterium]
EAGQRVLLEAPISEAGRRHADRTLATAPELRQLVDPVYAPDGKHILYVLSGQGESQIRRVNLATGLDEILVELPCLVLSPTFHPSGQELVFSADLNGVYNLYRMAPVPGAKPVPITHMLGGAFMPDFSPDGRMLAFSSYDSYGYRLVVTEVSSLPNLPTPLPEIGERWKTLPQNRERIAAVEKRPLPEKIESRPYRSMLALRPDFWSPWGIATGDGAIGGLVAAFSDPAGYQNIFLQGGYDSDLESPVAAAQWTYSGGRALFTMYGLLSADGYADLLVDSDARYYDYSEKVAVGGVALTLPFPTVDHQISLSLGYQFSDRSITDTARDDLAGRDIVGLDETPLYEGAEGAVWAAVEFFNGTAYSRSLSVEDGRYLYAGAEFSDPSLGGDLSRTRAVGKWYEYLSMPWGRNHVLKLQAVGGMGSGDEIAQGFFGLGGIEGGQITSSPGVPRNIGLRGYEENYQIGRNVALAGVSYRFPLFRLYRGATGTMPLYLKQAFGEFFYEGGMAWGSEPDNEPRNPWLSVVGTEINFSTTLFRLLDLAPGIGIAYAFDRENRDRFDGDDEDKDESKLQLYISLKASISF